MTELRFPLRVNKALLKRGLEEAVKQELNYLKRAGPYDINEAVMKFDAAIGMAEQYGVDVRKYKEAIARRFD